MIELSLDALRVRRKKVTVLDGITLTVSAGECVGLIGPNGAGKTTLMRAALGLLPHDGRSSLSALPHSLRAKHCTWMPQSRVIAWPMSVETIVALGRLPHVPKGSRLSAADQSAVDAALDTMALGDMRQRTATELSGGEQARVLIARALAQQTPLLMADEPTAGLDPAGQIAAMHVFSKLAQSNKAVIVSLHDLGLAARHCTRLLLLNEGRLVADGPPQTVLTQANLRDVFGVSAHFADTENGLVFQAMDVL